MADKQNLRAGHRGRVRDRFLREGLDGFLPHEVLELLLFYAVAQKDTKIMAHTLIAEFGSLFGVLEASEEELMRVEGIGAHTASFLKSLLPAVRYVMEEEPLPLSYQTPEQIGEYFVSYYRDKQAPSLDVALLNNRFEIIRTVHLCNGTLTSPKFSIRRAVEEAYACNAASVIFAYRTDKAIAFPSTEDFFLFRDMMRVLQEEGLHLAEIVLVSAGQYNTLLRYIEKGIWHEAVKSSTACSAKSGERGSKGEKAASIAEDRLSFLLSAAGGKRSLEKHKQIRERFKTLGGLLSLPYSALLEETGLSSAEAVFLKLLSPLYAYTNLERAKRSKPIFLTDEAIGSFFCGIYAGRTEETVSLLLLDENKKLIDIRLFEGGTVNTVMVVPRILVEAALKGRAHFVAMAHNHPSGTVTASRADISTTELVKSAFAKIDVPFLGHFIVNEREYKLL